MLKLFLYVFKKNNKILRKILRFIYTSYARFKSIECGKDLTVNYKSTFSGNIYFGNNCNFNGMTVIGGGTVRFGNNFHSGNSCSIITQNHNYDNGDAIPYDDTLILKTIVIGDNVWFGNNIIVTGNITIGEGVIAAAGSVIVKSIPDFAIVGGNPAKIIKYRNIDHYIKLKKAKKFC
ncbi:MAG: acyltransferase [Ignavibacteriae bacterium]|nr:acyltransferase [Ignavibacteriota bacterium]